MRVREMVEDDVTAVAGLRVRGWQAAYSGLMPQAYLDGLSVAEDAERQREYFSRGLGVMVNLIAESARGEPVGWACLGPSRDPDVPAGDAELYALYVRPELIGTGVGRALLTESLARARERGFPRMLLWVLRENARARRFYERAGFAPDGREQSDEVAGVDVPEVRYALRLSPPPDGSRAGRG
ncbi:GNAT family N-acetyltransferase [Streptomyces sp. LX-29]|uniref:GNAT family N-acetyltransferase n=1 Tax=Streptomyces sp. LX-29 TaxID=2900152 RepID=UPI00240D958A|nr:GNAT family N-acetyltransferase [Streptomyces sp. LX-29]WFB06786.1 GNAT family N-acetyltransferase [Streptomyces sp. LX-29]